MELSEGEERRLGAVIKILSESNRKSISIISTYVWLLPAIRHDQIIIQRGYGGKPLAFATWAYLTEEVSKNIVDNNPPLLHFSEWNEGTCLWIIDFVAPHGQLHILKNMLRVRLSSHHRSYRRFVRDSSNNICRIKKISVRSTDKINYLERAYKY